MADKYGHLMRRLPIATTRRCPGMHINARCRQMHRLSKTWIMGVKDGLQNLKTNNDFGKTAVHVEP